MSLPDPDLVSRGQAIFDRLRGVAAPTEPVDDEETESTPADTVSAEPATAGPGQAELGLAEPSAAEAGLAEPPAAEAVPPAPEAEATGSEDTAPTDTPPVEPKEGGTEAAASEQAPVVSTGPSTTFAAKAGDLAPDSAGMGQPTGPAAEPSDSKVSESASPINHAAAASPLPSQGSDSAPPVLTERAEGSLDSVPVTQEAEPTTPTPEASAALAPNPPAKHPAASRPLPRTIAIANQKGGVGKTTTTVNLGAALAELGFRVLVIDLDPQGNATTGLGINSRNLESSIYDVLLHDVALDDCIEPSAVRNLFVAPATIDLAGAEIELVPAFSRELRLRRAIESLDGQFDFTIIDCPPSLGLITVNGLAAATEIIVPIQCEYYALEGLGQLIKNVALVQGNLNPRLEISAIVLTMYDARTRLAEQVAQEVRAHFGDRVCRMVVPRTVRLSEAPSFGQPIITFDPSSRGAIAYRELAKEVSGGAP